LGREANDYTWTPLCPEVMSGLGVPREPIRLTSGNGDDFWQAKAQLKNRKGCLVSDEVKAGISQVMDVLKRAKVEAFIFMEGSPTCGVYRTTLKDRRMGKPPGVLGSLLLREDLFLIPAIDLDSPWKWWDWKRRLHAFVWLKRQEITSKQALYEIWHILKFMCQEADRPAADLIGQAIAAAPKKLTESYVREWKTRVLRLLRQPSSLNRISAVMVKHYSHYRKQLGLKSLDIQAPRLEQSKHDFIAELNKMEQRARRENYSFAGNPVIYDPDQRRKIKVEGQAI